MMVTISLPKYVSIYNVFHRPGTITILITAPVMAIKKTSQLSKVIETGIQNELDKNCKK